MFSLAEYLLLDVHVGTGKQLGIAVMTLHEIYHISETKEKKELWF